MFVHHCDQGKTLGPSKYSFNNLAAPSKQPHSPTKIPVCGPVKARAGVPKNCERL